MMKKIREIDFVINLLKVENKISSFSPDNKSNAFSPKINGSRNTFSIMPFGTNKSKNENDDQDGNLTTSNNGALSQNSKQGLLGSKPKIYIKKFKDMDLNALSSGNLLQYGSNSSKQPLSPIHINPMNKNVNNLKIETYKSRDSYFDSNQANTNQNYYNSNPNNLYILPPLLSVQNTTNSNKFNSENVLTVPTKIIPPLYIKVRYLNFRPYVDIPKYENSKEIKEEENEDEKSENMDTKNNSNTALNKKNLLITSMNFLKQKGTFMKNKYYFKFIGLEIPLIKNLLEDNGFIQCMNNADFSILWSSSHLKLEIYRELTRFQRVNHFPMSNQLTRKDLLYKNVSKLQEINPSNKKTLNFMPKSFLMPSEYEYLKEEMKKNEGSLWIVKPVSSSQGRGIYLTNDIQDISIGSNLIVSRYISDPYLINKKKFDLRIYVLLTSICPLRIYRFKEGLVRFAVDDYSSDLDSKCSHLTNYSINKTNKNYVKNNDPCETDFNSSKWNLKGLRKYLTSKSIDFDKIMEKIDNIIRITLISVEQGMQSSFEKYCHYNSNCFELFGFDILLDNSLNPWLLEVNLSPNLHYDAPIDLKIKGELIAEVFDMIRVVPYDLRNENYGNGFNISNLINNSYELKKLKITKDQREIIWESLEEYKRIKQFQKIFPTVKYNDYKKYFDKEREINNILYLIEKENH